MIVPSVIAERLEPDERVLWCGRPRPGFSFAALRRGGMLFWFGWMALISFWELKAVSAHLTASDKRHAIVLVLFGLPFVAIGLYGAVVSPVIAHLRRQRTFYAVTSRRVIATSELLGLSFKTHPLAGIASYGDAVLDGAGYLGFQSRAGKALRFHFAGLDPSELPAAASAVREALEQESRARERARVREETGITTRWMRRSNDRDNVIGTILITAFAMAWSVGTFFAASDLFHKHAEQIALLFVVVPFMATMDGVLAFFVFLQIDGLVRPHERTLAIDAEAIYWGNVTPERGLHSLRDSKAGARKPRSWSQGFIRLSDVVALHYDFSDEHSSYLYLRDGRRVHLPVDVFVTHERVAEFAAALKSLRPEIQLYPLQLR